MAFTRTRRRAAVALVILCAPFVAAGIVVAAAAPAGATALATHGSDPDTKSYPPAKFFFGSRSLFVTDDPTPTLSGKSAPSGEGVHVAISVVLNGTATDHTMYTNVRCVGAESSEKGTWSCTFEQPLHNGTFTLTLTQTVTTKHGQVHTGTATAHLRVQAPAVSVEPPPAHVPESPPEKTEEPAPPTVVTPPVPETPPTTPKAPTVAKTVKVTPNQVAPVTLQPIAWKFTVTDADGNDVSGQPLEPGDYLIVSSTGLPVGAKVLLEIHSAPTQMGWAIVTADGALSLAVRVPSDVPAGAHNLVATLTAPGVAPSVASVPVKVDAPAVTLSRTLDAGPLPQPAPTPAPAEPPTDTRGFNDSNSGIADSLPTLHDINAQPWRLAATGGLASAFVLLAALPAELLESTLSSNYGRAFGWLAPARKRVSRLRAHQPRFLLNPWVGGIITVALASAILGFSEADFGINAHSMRTFLALFLSLFMLNIAIGAIKLSVAARQLKLPGRLMPMPGALMVAAISVLVSRVMDISPSLLFGLVVGVSFARVESEQIEGKLALLAIGSTLALGICAWLWFSVMVDIFGRSEGFWGGLAEETLAATALESLSVLLVGLLPFHYLEGKALHAWNKRIWAGMYLICTAVFVFIAVPMGASWKESREPVTTWLAICLGFAIISIAAWAAFRFMPEREDVREREVERVEA